ncbi:hypothetical protein F3G15_28265, partial [Klebsiella pneumoniae]
FKQAVQRNIIFIERCDYIIVGTLNEYNIPLDSLFKPVPDSLMSEYLAMIDDQHPTGTMTA